MWIAANALCRRTLLAQRKHDLDDVPLSKEDKEELQRIIREKQNQEDIDREDSTLIDKHSSQEWRMLFKAKEHYGINWSSMSQDDRRLAIDTVRSGKALPSAPKGDGALYDAAFQGQLEDVKALLANGSSANLPNPERKGNTPLIAASLRGYEPIVEVLLQARADVNRANDDNRTPLICATFQNHIGVVKKLLEVEGIDRNVEAFGKTAVDEAHSFGYLSIALLFGEGFLGAENRSKAQRCCFDTEMYLPGGKT